MTDLMDVWRETLRPPLVRTNTFETRTGENTPPITASVNPQEHLDAYWLAVIGYHAAAAHSEIKHKDPQAAKRLLSDALGRYMRSPCVEPGEKTLLQKAMR